MVKKSFVYITLILVCIAILYIAFTYKHTKEGFAITKKAVDESPYKKFTRDDYVGESNNKYNRYADMIDARNIPFYGLPNESVRIGKSKSILEATSTSDLAGSTNLGTFNIDVLNSRLEPPRQNRLITEAMVCENVKTRKDACSKLDDPGFSKCGVCIKNGDSITYDNKNHIGGMLLLPSDRNAQIDAAGGEEPMFQPTGGKCPEGNFYVDKAECEKAVNRMECKEIGERGGWDGTTVEGIKVANDKCAQVMKQDNTFIYEPKGRKFNITLRVLTPTGTGLCRVWVYDAGNTQLAFAEGQPGVEFLVAVKDVKEYQTLSVVIAEEAPYRLKGKSELFGVETGGYNQTRESAEKLCQRIGTQLATMEQMTEAVQNGAQACVAGWGQDFCGYPAQAAHVAGGCGAKGFNSWCYNNPENKVTYAATYCYGIKPGKSKNEMMRLSIIPWFDSYGKEARPSQEDKPASFSRYGLDYVAPSLRAVLLQWEIDSTVPENAYTTRVVNFEPTIMTVNDQAPNNVSSDGTKTFRVLRKFGTFGASKDIVSPRPTASDKMLTNQFWLWGNDAMNQQVKFEVKIPGIFAPSFYQEDRYISDDGPLVGNRDSLKLLRSSPCFGVDQKPGNYSISCLKTLFIGAGGDVDNGKLATTGIGLSQLNGKGSVDDISDYLTDIYTLAVTGKDTNGMKVGSDPAEHKKLINDASQLLFGFDLCTPCEDVGEDKNGDIVFIPKEGTLDETCLDWLWMNTGRSTNREQGSGPNRIAPTYVAIGQRYSGLKENEASKNTVDKYPFQTCQRSGTLAPINQQGVVNPENVAKANAKRTVQAVQDWYNSIFQTANNKVTTKLKEKPQMEAVSQCYGVNKIVDKKCTATFYNNYNYTGQSAILEEGSYDFPSFTKLIQNDSTSSIKVDPGCKAKIFEHSLYEGRTYDITEDTPDLRNINLDKTISTAIISKRG